MDVKENLVDFLAHLPDVESPDKRRTLVIQTGFPHLASHLDLQGDNATFFLRLLDEFCRLGQAGLVSFLEALLQTAQIQSREQREIATQLCQEIRALSMDEWQTHFVRTLLEQTETDEFSFSPPSTLEGAVSKSVTNTFDQHGQITQGDQTNVAGNLEQAGVRAQEIRIHRLVIHQGAGRSGDSAAARAPSAAPADEPTLLEEQIRLDVAIPPESVVDEPFDLAVAVRQPQSPPLTVDELTQVVSGKGRIFRTEKEQTVIYRIAVRATGCTVEPEFYQVRLRPGQDSEPHFFQITSQRSGNCSIIVSAYQEGKFLAAQTRVRMVVIVPVEP